MKWAKQSQNPEVVNQRRAGATTESRSASLDALSSSSNKIVRIANYGLISCCSDLRYLATSLARLKGG